MHSNLCQNRQNMYTYLSIHIQQRGAYYCALCSVWVNANMMQFIWRYLWNIIWRIYTDWFQMHNIPFLFLPDWGTISFVIWQYFLCKTACGFHIMQVTTTSECGWSWAPVLIWSIFWILFLPVKYHIIDEFVIYFCFFLMPLDYHCHSLKPHLQWMIRARKYEICLFPSNIVRWINILNFKRHGIITLHDRFFVSFYLQVNFEKD